MHSQKKFQSYNQPKKKRWWFFGRKERSRVAVQKSEVTGLQYANPYSRVKKRGFKFPLKIVSISILFVSWFGLMLYLPFFRINQVSFEGLKIIKQEDIESYVRNKYLTANKWWPKNNYFLVGQGTLEKDLNNAFALNTVTVEKKFPSSIKVMLEEKVSTIIYDNGTGYYLLDQSGAVLKQVMLSDVKEVATSTQATSTSLANTAVKITTSTPSTSTPSHIPALKDLSLNYDGYPIVFDSRRLSVSEKQTEVLHKEVIQGILTIYNALKRNKLANVAYITLDDPNAGVTIHNEKPWTILMDPLAEISNQLENIRIITKDNKPIEYVDVRFGDRVYWK